MSKRYRTAWPHVTIKIADPASGKKTVAALGMDVIVPSSADPEDVQRLLAKGALVAEADPSEPEPKPQLEPEPKAEPKKAPVKPKSDS